MQHSAGRKGVAPIVGTVLLMVIGVAAVGLVGGLIISSLKNQPSLSPTLSCLDAQQDPPLRITAVCYNASSRELHVSIARKESAFAFSSLLVSLFESTGARSSFLCGEGCGLCQLGAIGHTKQYYLSSPLQPDTLRISAQGCEFGERTIVAC